MTAAATRVSTPSLSPPQLRADADHAEHDILRAYLEALVVRTNHAGASRQLIRALRNQLQNPEERKDLRAAVAAIVGEIPTIDSFPIAI